MKLIYLLLHDFRFASLGVEEFASNHFHFSKEYARRMAKAGHEVKLYVLTGETPRRKTFEIDGFELKVFRTSFNFPPFMRFGNDHSLEVLREIDRDSPDLIHFHNYYLWNFLYVAPWARRRGIPLVAQFHGTDPIRTLKAVVFSPSLRLCSRLLVPTKGEVRFLVQKLRIPSARVEMFPSTGVDTKTFRPTSVKHDSPLLLYAGRIPRRASYRWEKAPYLLLPMMKSLIARVPNARLLIAGDGPGLAALVADARQLGLLQNVSFLGPVAHERLAELFSQSWMTFVPIYMDDIEPYWGGTVQESLACGTPVAALNRQSRGFRRFGLLLPTDAREAAELVQEALADRTRLAQFGTEGLEFVRRNCEWEVVASRINGLYRSLCG